MAITSRTQALKVLGLPSSATEADIKDAYRKLRSTAHPDHGGTDQKFKDVQAAYDYLTDPRTSRRSAAEEDLRDFFRDMDQAAEATKREAEKERRARTHFMSKIVLSLSQAFNGCVREVTFDPIGAQTFRIEVPPGTQPGQRLRVVVGKSKWDPNLDVTIDVRASVDTDGYNVTWATNPQLYSGGIEGSGDIEKNLLVDWWTVMTGGKVQYAAIDGTNLEIRIPAGTAAGTVFKVKDRGFYKDMHRSARGDVYLRMMPLIPHVDDMSMEDIQKAMIVLKNALVKKRDPFHDLEKNKAANMDDAVNQAYRSR